MKTYHQLGNHFYNLQKVLFIRPLKEMHSFIDPIAHCSMSS